ncbi:hypothetical protein D9615_007008 [Tricholomella constricta]|uniref:G domain-containing protein n=1 Tax=Tricholomella constricta TaxID=117010 RepID=A0A8H5H8M2_9AGAR|nr:hypothetical protein D9615_007008 [Tricholomella constricta]
MSTDNTMTGAALSPEDLEEVRLYAGKFRILIIGRANAGKTTILQKVCKTNELPEVFDYAGYEVDQAGILDPSARRGMHDINHRLVFKSNPAFVFHDSRGFESGGVDELEAVKEFIAERAKHEELGDQLHAIWYCLPMDNSRPITRAEEIFFNEVGTGRVPVILIFTKFDGFVKSKFAEILDQVSDWSQAPAIALKEAIADFEKLQPSLAIYKYKYPPKKHVRLQDMDQPEASCQELIEQTSAALDNRALAQILIATQQNSAILSTAWAMGKLTLNYSLHIV